MKHERWSLKHPILADLIDMIIFFAISVGSLISKSYIGFGLFFLFFLLRLVDLVKEIKNKN